MKSVPTSLFRRSFTLVEIVLALVVAAVGVVGIIALFPVGLSKNKETISTRSAADAADQFLHTMAAAIQSDRNTIYAFPEEHPMMSEDGIVWSTKTLLSDSNTTVRFSSLNSTDSFDPMTHQDGLFKITQITPANIKDFEGVIRAWRNTEEIQITASTDISLPPAVVIPPVVIPPVAGGGDDKDAGDKDAGDKDVADKDAGDKDVADKDTGDKDVADKDDGKGNNGHGNNEDGVDVSNPGNGKGGPNGEDDPSGDVDDEKKKTKAFASSDKDSDKDTGDKDVADKDTGDKDVADKDTGDKDTGDKDVVDVPVVIPVEGDDDTEPTVTSSSSTKVNLFAEISWPESIPYEQRKKEVYSMMVFLPGEFTATTGDPVADAGDETGPDAGDETGPDAGDEDKDKDDKDVADKDNGDKDAGDKDAGDKDAGDKDAGDKDK